MSGASPRSLRIVYFGTTGRLSASPLRALFAAGADVRAVVLPALATGPGAPPIAPLSSPGARATPSALAPRPRRIAIPMANRSHEDNIVTVARQRQVPVFAVARLAAPQTVAVLGSLAPDLICVACFPWRLPPSMLALSRLGGINLHPSLLPDNRGPDPLFWTFQRGQRETGVTIHRMDAHLDTGPILAQERVAIREGIDEATLERELAERGAVLMVHVVARLRVETVAEQPQDETLATRFGWPTRADYEISPNWSARRAHIFACGLRNREQPALLRLAGQLYTVVEPLAYDESGALDVPWQIEDGILRLQCSPGVVRARVAPRV